MWNTGGWWVETEVGTLGQRLTPPSYREMAATWTKVDPAGGGKRPHWMFLKVEPKGGFAGGGHGWREEEQGERNQRDCKF